MLLWIILATLYLVAVFTLGVLTWERLPISATAS